MIPWAKVSCQVNIYDNNVRWLILTSRRRRNGDWQELHVIPFQNCLEIMMTNRFCVMSCTHGYPIWSVLVLLQNERKKQKT